MTIGAARTKETIEIEAADGHRLGAYLASPAGRARGGIVVIQEVFGVTHYIRNVCDSFAADGYTAIAPALDDRQRRNTVYDRDTIQEARRLRAALVWDDVIADCAASYGRISAVGKVGIVGYCVGGSVAWLAASAVPFAAASCYYGKDIVDFLDRPPRCPTILHFGAEDRSIPASDIDKIRARYPAMPIHVYPTGHGFDCPDRAGYHAASAELARSRTDSLLKEHVG